MKPIRAFLHVLIPSLLAVGSLAAIEPAAVPKQRRIVNLYNFIRNSDYRLQNSEEILFEATRQQIELIKPTKLPVTWALQYDALMNPRYQKLLKEQAGPEDEIAAWWEIPRPLVQKAGIPWRGHDHEWDSTANVGFSPGYTPDERRKLVDVYMADFKQIFGRYPLSVGSWFIDEVTLAYMAEKYGIIASCNCKDQIGTDGYTLWGGYWNQAYYPSKLNAYMPAQHQDAQINVPVFRMLGSDPIYQYGRGHGISSLEPVYRQSGGSQKWVDWFFGNLISQPSLGFAYTQAGQENSFGWDSMKTGLTLQVKLLAEQSAAGKLQVMTLADAGRWFKTNHPLTPATSVVYLDDWKNENRRTVWYNSRFFRANILWEDNGFFIRDIHRFDERMKAPTHDSPLTTNTLAFTTQPVMDSALWSDSGPAGLFFRQISGSGEASPLVLEGAPVVKELNATDLGIVQPLANGARIVILCGERSIRITGTDAKGQPLPWACDLRGGGKMKERVTDVGAKGVIYQGPDGTYRAGIAAGGAKRLDDGAIRMSPDATGKLEIVLGEP